MSKVIEIEYSLCIKCNACVEVCPSHTLINGLSRVEVESPMGCIVCGHCVAICPKMAISHNCFGADKIHSIQQPQIDANELLNLIRLRRSNRTFTDKRIAQQHIDMIIEAAYRAPTASNIQGVKFILVRDKKTISKLIDLTINHYKSLLRLIDNPIIRPIAIAVNPTIERYLKTFKRVIEERKNGNDPILRGSTTLLLIYTDNGVRFGREDANLAYQNGSLMAESIGIAQVYTGFLCSVSRSSKKINRLLNIKNGTIHAGMALGIPRRIFQNYIDKRDINLNIID